MKLLSLGLACSLLLAAGPAWAMATNARALGMGYAQGAIADDADMAAWNPALLGLRRPRSPQGLLLTIPANMGLGNSFLSPASLMGLLPDEHGNSRNLEEGNIKALLSGFTGDGWFLAVDGGTRMALASPFLRTALVLQADVDVQDIGLPKGIVELLFQGNTDARDIKASGLKGGTISGILSAGVSHAIPINLPFGRQSAIGGTLRYLNGLGWAVVSDASGSILARDDDGKIYSDALVRYQYTHMRQAGNSLTSTGTGLAGDIGFANVWNDNITWGLTVGNLGFIKWNNIQDQISTVKVAPTNAGLGFSGNNTPKFDNALTTTNGDKNGLSEIDGKLPMFARLSFSWNGAIGLPRLSNDPSAFNTPPVPVLVAADLQQGFGTGYGITMIPQLSLGVEARPLGRWLPLRTGITFGGVRPMAGVGAGLDLGLFRLDLASGTMYGILNSAKGYYYTLTASLTF